MDTATKIKLIMPVMYAGLAMVHFMLTWPDQVHIRHYISVALTLAAFVFWLLARVQLGNSFSLSAQAKGLVTTGLYARFRHPVYYFSILAAVGIGLYIFSPLVLPVIVLLILVELYRINREEKVLTNTFGQSYVEYKRKTWF